MSQPLLKFASKDNTMGNDNQGATAEYIHQQSKLPLAVVVPQQYVWFLAPDPAVHFTAKSLSGK